MNSVIFNFPIHKRKSLLSLYGKASSATEAQIPKTNEELLPLRHTGKLFLTLLKFCRFSFHFWNQSRVLHMKRLKVENQVHPVIKLREAYLKLHLREATGKLFNNEISHPSFLFSNTIF